MNKIQNNIVGNKSLEDGILERSKRIRSGVNFYTEANPPKISNSKISDIYRKLRIVNKGIKEILLFKENTDESSLDNTVLLPPSELFTDIIPPEGEGVATDIENATYQQFIQQFYEAYLAPVGLKEVFNRLGEIAGNIDDLHSLYPEGVSGLIAEDSKASWNTSLNFAFTVDEGLGTELSKYSSLSFPPFISHDSISASDFLSQLSPPGTIEESATDSTFDMKNVLYKRGKATFRQVAFKQINDNINLLQTLLNRGFGVESTYLNEWDMSLYMQEGILSYEEKIDPNGELLRVPNFVTNMTYGLLDDAPIEILKKANGNADANSLDLDKITPFASINCAVSSRYGVDNFPIGQQLNTLDYVIADYPLSAYWTPGDYGEKNKNTNVSFYITDLFSYKDCGMPFNENEKQESQYTHNYTPDVFHGKDLAKSKKPLYSVINYADARYALLSGWNATDSEGEAYLSSNNRINGNTISNAYSYLPFWKQFYTNDEDGLSDLDKYLQEIYATDTEVSILDAAYQIVDLITSDNAIFQNMKMEKKEKFLNAKFNTDELSDEAMQEAKQEIAEGFGADDYDDYKIMKVRIKGSRLLKMFLKRSKITKKAMAQANQAGANISTPDAAVGSSVSPSAAIRNCTPTKVLGSPEKVVIDGVETEVSTYTPTEPGDLCSKKSVGDGIAEWSPFLYGGPHGKYLSPLTLEGYTQFGNETLATVPTVDPPTVYQSKILNVSGQKVRGLEFSKNFKSNGSFIDTVTLMTPNERDSLLGSGGFVGIQRLNTYNGHIANYHSNLFPVSSYWESKVYRTRRRFFRRKRKVPDWRYEKFLHIYNGNVSHWVNFPYHYGTTTNWTYRRTSRYENTVSTQEDLAGVDFRLLPVYSEVESWERKKKYNSYFNKAHNQTELGEIRNRIAKDTATFRRKTEWWYNEKEEKIEYKYRPETDWDPVSFKYRNLDFKTKYLLVPVSDGADVTCGYASSGWDWRHIASYSKPGTKWYNQLRNLYNSGTREVIVSLPITDSSSRNITNIVCGIAEIKRSKIQTYRLTLACVGHSHYRRHGCSWCCPHRVCYRYWTWVYVKVTTYAYNMYFRPEKMYFNLPTDYLLNKVANYTDQRNFKSSNIVERYTTDGKNVGRYRRFSSLDSGEAYSPTVFPFTIDFINRFGRYEPYLPLPGYSAYQHVTYAGSLKILHSKGLYYGNVAENYRKNGYVRRVKQVRPYYPTWRGNVDYYESAASPLSANIRIPFRDLVYRYGWWYAFYYYFYSLYRNKASTTWRSTREVVWTNYERSWVVSQYETDWELTNLFRNAQRGPSVQVYQEGETPYMTWYRTEDVINVYIDTCTVQLAWLKEMETYADLYLTDALIYDLYTRSVDNRIQSIMKRHKAGEIYGNSEKSAGVGGWTPSFSEDINYHDALAIVERAFNTNDPNRNTIKALVSKRIKHLTALKKYAVSLKNSFKSNSTSIMKNFTVLSSNTYALLQNAVTSDVRAEDYIFDSKGHYNGKYFSINKNTVYDLTKNPSSLVWAYLNVLYQVRKYWVNMRFNKRAGSFWQLRGLERVLSFVLADKNAEDNSWSSKPKSIPQGSSREVKNKKIVYVQTRTSFADTLNTENSDMKMTEAVYVKVNYIGTPKPEKSSKWNAETGKYDGDEICYVKEAFQYARKPEDGLYYVMSNTINLMINNATSLLKETTNLIVGKQYVVTEEDYNQLMELLKKLSSEEWKKVSAYTTIDNKEAYAFDKFDNVSSTNPGFKQCIELVGLVNKTVKESFDSAEKVEALPRDLCKVAVTVFINELLEYKKAYYMNEINSALYPVYIKWNPQHTWSGSDESEGDWYIDEWQKKETQGKERTVTDLYGKVHTSTEGISAGILFGASAGLRASVLLDSPSVLSNSSVLETLCSSMDKMDLWRIQIPKDLNIPSELLVEKPVLVPAYQIDVSMNGLATGKVRKNTRSVLAGIETNSVIPVLETTEDILTVNTLSALGKFENISTIGLSVDQVVKSGN